MTMVHRPTEFDLVVTDAVAPAPAGVEVMTAFAMTPPLSLRTVPVRVSVWAAATRERHVNASAQHTRARRREIEGVIAGGREGGGED
jgi:hypothetical protein